MSPLVNQEDESHCNGNVVANAECPLVNANLSCGIRSAKDFDQEDDEDHKHHHNAREGSCEVRCEDSFLRLILGGTAGFSCTGMLR